MRIAPSQSPQVVHLELHTSDREASTRFYRGLLQWQTERIDTAWGSYQALKLGADSTAGSSSAGRAWPAGSRTSRSIRSQRARVWRAGWGRGCCSRPREGPAGWRAVLSTPAGGEIALWQPKPQPLKVES